MNGPLKNGNAWRVLCLVALLCTASAWGRNGAPRPGKGDPDLDLEPLRPKSEAASAPAAPPPPPEPAAPQPAGPACQIAPSRALAEGPVVLGFFSSDQATPRRACPRTELGLQVGGDAEIDIPLFRALMGGGATLFGSYALSDRLEVFGTFEVFRMTYSQNASLSVLAPGIGSLSGGATLVAYESDRNVLSVTGRLQLPTASTAINARSMILEAGALFSRRFGPGFSAHGFAGLDFGFAITPAEPGPRLGLLTGAGLVWSPTAFLSVAFDLQAHFGHRAGRGGASGREAAPLDYLAPALAVRFAASEALGFELALGTHLLGDRAIRTSPGLVTESGLMLRGHYRF